jgi:tight adherence protein B
MATRPVRRLLAAVVACVLAPLGILGVAGIEAVAGAPAASAASPGDGGAGAIEVGSADVSHYPTVSATLTLPASLADRGLGADAFTVEEAGEARPARITRLAGDQLAVVLAIDTSGSIAGAALDGAKAAAGAFLDRLPADARVAVVGFGATPVVASPLSTDRAALRGAVSGLSARGETSLYDAVSVALDQLAGEVNTRAHVVLLSDGRDTVSTTGLDALTSRLAAAGVGLDVAELSTPDTDSAALTRLAQAGSGHVVSASDPAALAGIYDALGRGLANQYRLEFDATGHGATPVHVVVRAGQLQAEAQLTLELPAAAPTTGGTASTSSAAAATIAAPTAEAAPSGSGGIGSWALLAGAAACFAALLVGLGSFTLNRREGDDERLRPAAALGLAAAGSSSFVARLSRRATDATEGALARHGRTGRLNEALERAGLALRPGELVMLDAAAAVTGLAFGSLVGGLFFGLVLAVLGALSGPAVLSILARRRRNRFNQQLADNLQLLSGTLRTGYGIVQAIDVVAREAEAPTRDEFRRVVVETRLGRDLADSLEAVGRRIGGEDFGWVIEAIEINREVGGDLAEVLDNVADTIRERDRVRRQVKAVSAEGRLSAYVLVALPIGLGGILAMTNPGYFGELTRGGGLVLAGAGLGMLAIGSFWLSRMVKVKF